MLSPASTGCVLWGRFSTFPSVRLHCLLQFIVGRGSWMLTGSLQGHALACFTAVIIWCLKALFTGTSWGTLLSWTLCLWAVPSFSLGWQVYHLLRHHRCFPLNKIQWDNIEKLLPHRWHWRSFSKWFLVHTLSPSHSFLALKQFSEFQPRIMASRSVIRDVIAYPHSICFKLEILVTPASPIIIFNWCNYPSACSCYKSCILSLLYSSLFSVFAMCSFSL